MNMRHRHIITDGRNVLRTLLVAACLTVGTAAVAQTQTGVRIGGSVYGGGKEGDVTMNTTVNIGVEGEGNINITGNVFGGGKGLADEFECKKAMVSKGSGVDDVNAVGTAVTIHRGTIVGDVYGGGEVGRVEKSTVVTIGTTGTAPTIGGDVFGAGAGVKTHGYAALVRGQSRVTVQGGAQVGKSVYGGGKLASVGKYNVALTSEVADANHVQVGEPYGLDENYALATFSSGKTGDCFVTIRGSAVIGTENDATTGHVFGGGKGTEYFEGYDTTNDETKLATRPKRWVKIESSEDWDTFIKYKTDNDGNLTNEIDYEEGSTMIAKIDKTKYYTFVKTLGLVGSTDVKIDGAAQVMGSVYGGGSLGVTYNYSKVTIGETASSAPSIGGNVYGAGKGYDDGSVNEENGYPEPKNFTCDQGEVKGCQNDAEEDVYAGTGAEVLVYNGTVSGTVYGGGEVGRVEKSTKVTIGSEGTAPSIGGNVFGAGKGTPTHGYSALVRGEAQVVVQGGAKVGRSVYGGGELASVGKFNVAMDPTTASDNGVQVGEPYSMDHNYLPNTGKCSVTIKDNAEIGPASLKMNDNGKPDDYGHVFGGGKGTLPYMETAKRMKNDDTWQEYVTSTSGGENGEDAYFAFIKTLGITGETEVIVQNNAFVKGSVYGGSENGRVMENTHVTITGNCQIGIGKNASAPYSEWPTTAEAINTAISSGNFAECDHWDYVPSENAPYDMFVGQKYKDVGASGYSTDATYDTEAALNGKKIATDGHTFFGNVFGGGSGSTPFAPGRWLETAGVVDGNTVVDITGGHILTSVYGGNEMTNVKGSTTINMSAGTVGVPRSVEAVSAYPMLCCVYGGGKGDPRTFFNQWTNVASATVNITGTAVVYGSVFGGGEDGHVLGSVTTNIGDVGTTDGSAVLIGSTGQSGSDGNVFGGGRGFSADAFTAGVVCGDVNLTITDGTILGNVYGGGELASVGTYLVQPGTTNSEGKALYGKMMEDGNSETVDDPTTIMDERGTHGHVAIRISGGTIGTTTSTTSGIGGNVFGACKGTPINPTFGIAKFTEVNITGGTVWRNVYGGGQLGEVQKDTHVIIGSSTGDPTIHGTVFGAGSGSEVADVDAAAVFHDVTVDILGGTIDGDVYGGGEIANSNVHNTSYGGHANSTGVNPEGSHATETIVNLFGGIIKGDAYGGGKGKIYNASNYTGTNPATGAAYNLTNVEANCAALVYGDVTVNLGDAMHDATAFEINKKEYKLKKVESEGKVSYVVDNENGTETISLPSSGRIFGCNNLNGSPKGTVLVQVAKTWGLKEDGSRKASTDPKPAITDHKNYATNNDTYELEAVYGGGNLAPYNPDASALTKTGRYTANNHDAANRPLQVVIDGCGESSIHYVYGGGNAAAAPQTDVVVLGTHEIGDLFGGGNGLDKITYDSTTFYDNPGADVGIMGATHDPSTKLIIEGSGDEYASGVTKQSHVIVYGGMIHRVFGGSNTLGDILGGANVKVGDDNIDTGCDLNVKETYAGGNDAPISGGGTVDMGCVEYMPILFGGANNADFNGDVVLNITGGHYHQVFGGNNLSGALKGSITVNIEEKGCLPIVIDELYGGGNYAPYSKYGYSMTSGAYDRDANDKLIPLTSADSSNDGFYKVDGAAAPKADPQIKIISATYIGKIYGGGLGAPATMVGSPHVNINMKEGTVNGKYKYNAGSTYFNSTHMSAKWMADTLSTYIKYDETQEGHYSFPHTLSYGTIGSVYGGGNAAKVIGDTYINIGTGVTYTGDDAASDYAYITDNVFGGGNQADITGNTNVTISGSTKNLSAEDDAVSGKVQGSVYIGGSVYGGGNLGSVGTFQSGESPYDGTAMPTACTTGTGLCTVTINGYAEIGPDGMQMTASGGPADFGHVFGASRGALPDEDASAADITAIENATFVNKTNVTIGGWAFVKGSVYGGSENGHVLNDTHVTIADHCQIGNGDGVNRRYTERTEDEIGNVSGEWATSTNLAECASWPYDSANNGESYDKFADRTDYDARGGAVVAEDGRTFYGNVFGGGSGFYPYAPGKWLATAGNVYGNTTVDITGGHILTSVYGGNEMTDVGKFTFNADGTTTIVSGGNTTINMTGGTVGVPRTDDKMREHPVTCYVFGAGKGDPRTFFNQFTNVANTTVNVTGTARIFGSTFGGGEDGHVVGNVVTNIGDIEDLVIGNAAAKDYEGSGVIIGSTGTSGVDGNVFGAGRGYSALALTIGVVQGNATTNINNGKIYGSVFGGGRTASVGTYQVLATLKDANGQDIIDEETHEPKVNPLYGKMLDCNGTDDPETPENEYHNHGHVFVNISGNAEIGRIDDNVANERGETGGMLAVSNALATGEKQPSIGDVFGGGKGLALHDNPELSKQYGWVKNTTVNISGDAKVNGSVYGGGEISSVGKPDENPDSNGHFKTGFAEVNIFGNATIGTLNNSMGEFGKGYVYGSSKGIAGSHYSEDAFVKYTKVTIGAADSETDATEDDHPTVYGSVFGGGEDGHVRKDAAVFIKAGTIGSKMVGYNTIDPDPDKQNYKYDEWYFDPEDGASNVIVYRGNVYAGGRGVDRDDDDNLDFSPTAGAVYGDASVTMTGGHVFHNIYGSGSMASVGTIITKDSDGNLIMDSDGSDAKPVNYSNAEWDTTTGHVTVTVTGGIVGDNTSGEAEGDHHGRNNGRVFGAGRGLAGNIESEAAHLEYVYSSTVTIGGTAEVLGAVFGGGENGHVKTDTEVNIEGNCIIGTPLLASECEVSKNGAKGNAFRGNVFGGGRGVDASGDNSSHRSFTAGRVFGNTTVNVRGGLIYRAVYGGGMLANVGNPTRSTDRVDPTHTGGTAADKYFTIVDWPFDPAKPNGVATVNITGGWIGNVDKVTGLALEDADTPDEELVYGRPGRNNGAVFGSGAGFMATDGTSDQYSQLAYVYRSYVNISDEAGEGGKHTHIRAAVFGGGENGHVWENATVNISGGKIGNEPDGTDGGDFAFAGNVFGSGRGMNVTQDNTADIVSTTAGWVKGNTTVNIWAADATYPPVICRDVYGGGNLGSVGDKDEVKDSAPLEMRDKFGFKTGLATVNILGGNIYGNVYGSSRGGTSLYHEYQDMSYVKNTVVTISGSANIHADEHTDGDNGGYVYGGGNAGHVRRNTEVNIGAAQTIKVKKGIDLTTESKEEVASVSASAGGTVDETVFGAGRGDVISPTAGLVNHNVLVNINDGATIGGDVYGGGAIGNSNVHDQRNPASSSLSCKEICTTVVNLNGGVILGDAYGGGQGVRYNESEYSEYTEDQRTAIEANCAAIVYGDVTLNLNKHLDDLTGDEAKAAAKGCVVVGRLFGANNVNGTPKGSSTVHVYGTQNVNATQIGNSESVTTAKVDGRYDVTAVYGGGNMAAYEPTDATSTNETTKATAHTTVIIDGCELTSIRTVYGGGNAASTPATDLTVEGTYEIEEVFGGGNGKDDIVVNGVTSPNPGANVGFYDYSAVEDIYPTITDRQEDEFKSQYTYGSGKVNVNINGGTIHRVFGGSNKKGNVRIVAVTMLEDANGCDFCVDEAYGGGKEAPMDGAAKLMMACIPGLKAAYGGAQEANINNDVTLNITNGTFDRVFGGNNISGTISGSITVNVEETGCRPVIIGELYGGGNQAAYSIYGYKEVPKTVTNDDGTETTVKTWEPRVSATDDGEGPTSPYANPVVNVKSFTSIGKVFGGGYGKTAVMVGNPTVNVNEVVGLKADKGPNNEVIPDGVNETVGTNMRVLGSQLVVKGSTNDSEDAIDIPSHEKGKIGAINEVYGGGNAAKVIGNTTVNIGTKDKELFVTPATKTVTTVVEGSEVKTEVETTDAERTHTVIGVDIRGNVYGGGNAADVTGNTHVVIGKEEVITPPVTP